MVAGDCESGLPEMLDCDREEVSVNRLDALLLPDCVSIMSELIGSLDMDVHHGPISQLGREERGFLFHVMSVLYPDHLHAKDLGDPNFCGHFNKRRPCHVVFLFEREEPRVMVPCIAE